MARIKKTRSKKVMDRLVADLELKQARKDEPDWSKMDLSGQLALTKAYNWLWTHYDAKEAHGFLVSYLKAVKFPKKDLTMVEESTVDDLVYIGMSLGWQARLLKANAALPKETTARFGKKLYELIDRVASRQTVVAVVPKRSVQDNIRTAAHRVIETIEGALDDFTTKGEAFDIVAFIRNQNIGAGVSKLVADKYQPLLTELNSAVAGKDADLKHAYSTFSKPKLKAFAKFVADIVGAFSQTVVTAAQTPKTRKVRVAKVKPVAVQVKKVKLAESFGQFKSAPAAKLVGAQQAWVFNGKTRMLGVYNAIGPAGLAVKGTTLLGFDPDTAQAKKLRKPDEQLKMVIETGKVGLRTVLTKIKAKPKTLTGRLNSDTIIVRIVS